MKEINRKNLEAIGFNLDEKTTEMLKSNIDTHYEYYVSHDRTYVLQTSMNNMALKNGWGSQITLSGTIYEY